MIRVLSGRRSGREAGRNKPSCTGQSGCQTSLVVMIAARDVHRTGQPFFREFGAIREMRPAGGVGAKSGRG